MKQTCGEIFVLMLGKKVMNVKPVMKKVLIYSMKILVQDYFGLEILSTCLALIVPFLKPAGGLTLLKVNI